MSKTGHCPNDNPSIITNLIEVRPSKKNKYRSDHWVFFPDSNKIKSDCIDNIYCTQLCLFEMSVYLNKELWTTKTYFFKVLVLPSHLVSFLRSTIIYWLSSFEIPRCTKAPLSKLQTYNSNDVTVWYLLWHGLFHASCVAMFLCWVYSKNSSARAVVKILYCNLLKCI